MRIDAGVVVGLRAAGDGPVCAYVYDLDGLRAHAAAAVAALPAATELFYALKANSERPIIEALAGIVAGFEVGSAGEIELVRAAAPGAPIVFGGPGKTDAALAAAARARRGRRPRGEPPRTAPGRARRRRPRRHVAGGAAGEPGRAAAGGDAGDGRAADAVRHR